tara:strand:- start:2671 stop:2904 length:234 start_codon:yes stop_codon:yes gene_type:complete
MKRGDLVHVPANTTLYRIGEVSEAGMGVWKPKIPRVGLFVECFREDTTMWDSAVLIDGKKYYLTSRDVYEMEDPNGY